jgi:signal transduction histidine kinase/PAS domain-containing protein
MTSVPSLEEFRELLERHNELAKEFHATIEELKRRTPLSIPFPQVGENEASKLVQTANARTDETTPAPVPRSKRDSSPDRAPRPSNSDPYAVSPAQVVNSLDDVIWSASPDGQILFYLGDAVEYVYGTNVAELQDKRGRWLDAIPPDDRERFRTALARLPDTGCFTIEHCIERPGRSERWAITRAKLVRDHDGRPLRVDGITTDTTQAGRPRTAIFAILEALGCATGKAFLAAVTDQLCRECDLRAAVIVEPHPQSFGEARTAAVYAFGRAHDAFTVPANTALLRELLAGGAVNVPTDATTRYRDEPLLLRLRANAFAAEPLVDERGQLFGFVAVSDDREFGIRDMRSILRALAPRITIELTRLQQSEQISGSTASQLAAAEQRATTAENMLRASANLATVGQLAACVTHDVQNQLSVVYGTAELIREGLPKDSELQEHIRLILQNTDTVAATSKQLLALGRPNPPDVSLLDVTVAIRLLEPMLLQLTGRRFPLSLELAPSLPLIMADAHDFNRMLLNLMLNARDASEPGKPITLRVTTTQVEANRPEWPGDLLPGRYVTISVIDSGCGMPPEVRARIFTPFFTTKGDSGTGLGLVIVRDVVSRARGHIEVETERHWGTTMRVFWPAVPDSRSRT